MSILNSYNRFKHCPNKKNYNKLVWNFRKKMRKIPFRPFIILRGENGVIIFNSEENNTWCKYKKGEIRFNNIR